MEEEEYIIEAASQPDVKHFNLEGLTLGVLSPNVAMCQGCGALLGLKLALQVLGRSVVVLSTGCAALLVKYPNNAINMPVVHAGMNAAAAATAISRAIANDTLQHAKQPINVLCYAGDGATLETLPSLISAIENNENFIYICYNNQGYGIIGKIIDDRSLIKHVGKAAAYAATTSLFYYEDFVKKLRKASALKGVRFIELLAPCPVRWGFDPSNTIEISRLAVETGSWPLYEIENKKINVTEKFSRLEPIEKYLEVQKRYSLNNEKIQAMQEKIRDNWKRLNEGKM